jgi:heme/copper-type cytochrome/quinol oxidase subunit 2
VSTIVHLFLAVVLTLFVVCQATLLTVVLRYQRALVGARRSGRTDLVWTSIPIVVVLLLAARSWLAVLAVEQPVLASAVTQREPGGGPRSAGPQ